MRGKEGRGSTKLPCRQRVQSPGWQTLENLAEHWITLRINKYGLTMCIFSFLCFCLVTLNEKLLPAQAGHLKSDVGPLVGHELDSTALDR